MEKLTIRDKAKRTNFPHNNFFKKGFKILKVIVDFFEEYVEELKGKLDSNSLQVVSDTWFDSFLGEHRGDILYSVKWKDLEVFVNVLLEHKIKGQNPRLQVHRYVILKATEEDLIIRAENRARKKAKKPLLDKKLTLIIPIVIYHGKTKLDKRALSELFALPDEGWSKFVPNTEIIFVDLSEIPDERLFQTTNKILSAFLILLKHTGDKEFLKQHSKKIFKFAEEKSAGEQTIELIKAVVMYIYQTFKLEEEEVQQLVDDIPEKAGEELANTYDILIARGKRRRYPDWNAKRYPDWNGKRYSNWNGKRHSNWSFHQQTRNRN